jgi:hypothetical protein
MRDILRTEEEREVVRAQRRTAAAALVRLAVRAIMDDRHVGFYLRECDNSALAQTASFHGAKTSAAQCCQLAQREYGTDAVRSWVTCAKVEVEAEEVFAAEGIARRAAMEANDVNA